MCFENRLAVRKPTPSVIVYEVFKNDRGNDLMLASDHNTCLIKLLLLKNSEALCCSPCSLTSRDLFLSCVFKSFIVDDIKK